jgi:tetratricopeptide (TPR) repeat protein
MLSNNFFNRTRGNFGAQFVIREPRRLKPRYVPKVVHMKYLVLLFNFSLTACAGIGFVASSDPDVKIQQAYQLMGQDRALLAEDVIRQALAIYEDNGNTLGMAEAYHAYGNLYMSDSYHGTWAKKFQEMGTYDGSYIKAVNNLQKSKDLFGEAGSEIGVVKSLGGIANAYHAKGEHSKACDYYAEALSRYRSGKASGKITKEPVFLVKGVNNTGELLEAYIKQYDCHT